MIKQKLDRNIQTYPYYEFNYRLYIILNGELTLLQKVSNDKHILFLENKLHITTIQKIKNFITKKIQGVEKSENH